MPDEGQSDRRPRRSAAGTIMAETVRELREAQRWAAAARQATLALEFHTLLAACRKGRAARRPCETVAAARARTAGRA